VAEPESDLGRTAGLLPPEISGDAMLRAPVRLAESEERFRQLAENIGGAFFMDEILPDGGERLLYVSPGYERIWGREAAELYRDGRAWFAAVHPADRAAVAAALGAAIAELLRAGGHRVTVADGIASVLAAAAAASGEEEAAPGAVDLVLSDLGLPDGSGLDLMRELAGRYGLRGIALSGYGMDEDVRKSREAGFRRHLTKPVTIQRLRAAITEAIEGTEPAAPAEGSG
jgi:CheY-like chemotaxis protein